MPRFGRDIPKLLKITNLGQENFGKDLLSPVISQIDTDSFHAKGHPYFYITENVKSCIQWVSEGACCQVSYCGDTQCNNSKFIWPR